jgi:AsmA protein
MLKKFRQAFKYIGFSLLAIIVLILLLPFLIPGTVKDRIKTWGNQSIEGKFNFSNASFSMIRHFPSLTLSLENFSLLGPKPFQQDTLLAAKEIGLGIDFLSLLKGDIKINKFFIEEGDIHIIVDENGNANYNVYHSKPSGKKISDTVSTSLKLEAIRINDSRITYDDRSTKLFFKADSLDYKGEGELDKEVFDLHTNISMKHFFLEYDKEPYISNKEIRGKLITTINTNSLALKFSDNDININRLPVIFNGSFNFLDKGYAMDFRLESKQAELYDLFTAFPPQYQDWLQQTEVKGKTNMLVTLKGDYLPGQSMPTLTVSADVWNGYIKHSSAPVAIENFQLKSRATLPSLDIEKMQVQVDTAFFKVKDKPFSARLKTIGFSKPYIDGKVRADLDLALVDAAAGIDVVDMKGAFFSDVIMKGNYDPASKKLPGTNAFISLKNGYIKTAGYPNAIEAIDLSMRISNDEGYYSSFNGSIQPLKFQFEGKPFTIMADVKNLDDITYNIRSNGILDIGKIYKVFAIEGYDVNGLIKTDLSLEGKQSDAEAKRYRNLHNKGTLELQRILLHSNSFPKPFLIDKGLFSFNQDKLQFTGMTMEYGRNRLVSDGYFQNTIPYALGLGKPLKGIISLRSERLFIDEFEYNAGADSVSASPSTVVMIPNDLDLQLKTQIREVLFNGISIKDFSGNAGLNHGTAILENTSFNMIGAPFVFNAYYTPKDLNNADFTFSVKADSFDVERAYKEIALFREMASAAASAKGKVGIDYSLSGKLDSTMFPILPSIKGGGELYVRNVKMKGFRLMNAVSRATGKNDVRDPDLKKITVKSTIKNNIMTIERVKMRVAGFRPRFEGQVSLDGRYNLKGRLGLPPL